MAKWKKFVEIAKPNKDGWSEKIPVDSLPPELQFGNGGSWARASSLLCKQFKVELFKEGESGNKNTHIQLQGYNKGKWLNQTIRKDIRDFYKNENCITCASSTRIEIDHKDGRKDDPRVMSTKTQVTDDFQPLCKSCNDRKRQVCKECKANSNRFDAKTLGFECSVVEGNLMYEGTCHGCYWYDSKGFISKHSEILKVTQ